MTKAALSAIPDRSPTPRPSKAPPPRTSPQSPLRSPSASCEKPSAAGSTRPRVRSSWETGAPWIWNLADEHFPGALQIVDRYHAKEHLSNVAKAIYGPSSGLGTSWTKRRWEELDAGKIDSLPRAVRRHAATHEAARQAVDHIQRNRHRMRYDLFHSQGLCTSSGVDEAGCKVAIGTRLKRAGMHWTLRGANAIIALRRSKLSRRFEDFWERRAQAQGDS